MNGYSSLARWLLMASVISCAYPQTQVDLRTQARNVDFSAASSTKPSKTGTILPLSCSVGETFFKIDAPPGQNLYGCTATNLWTLLGALEAGSVTSVFGRGDDVTAEAGDYTAAQVTNAADRTAPNSYTAGAKQTFAPDATTAGMRIAPGALPSAPEPGDVVFDSGDSNRLKSFDGTSWVAVGQGVANFAVSFTDQTTVAAAGEDHELGTANLIVSCYDDGTPSGRIEADSVFVDPTTYDVTVTFHEPQSGRCVINGSGGSSGGSATSGGASMGTQLGDFDVNRTTGTVLTIGPSCSAATPCNVRFGSHVYSLTESATVSLTAGTGTAYIYIANGGFLTVGHNVSASCSAGCTAQSGVTSFPPDSVPLFTWTAANGVWTSGGGSDQRAWLSVKNVVSGTGLTATESSGQTTVAVDSAVVPTFLTGTAIFDFSLIPSGACATDQTFSLTGASVGDAVAPGWPAGWEAGLIGTMRVSSDNTIAVRLCNVSGGSLDPTSKTFRATILRSF